MTAKSIIVIFAAVVICIASSPSLDAWNGEPSFDPESREEILRKAREMTEFSWSPAYSFVNYTDVNSPSSCNFAAGAIKNGEAYTQHLGHNLQNWSEFYNYASNSIQANNLGYYLGNDCSAFVSQSWKLPTRYNTQNFEDDAVQDGGVDKK